MGVQGWYPTARFFATLRMTGSSLVIPAKAGTLGGVVKGLLPSECHETDVGAGLKPALFYLHSPHHVILSAAKNLAEGR